MSLRRLEAIPAQPNKVSTLYNSVLAARPSRPDARAADPLHTGGKDAGKLTGTMQAGQLRHANYSVRRECAKGI